MSAASSAFASIHSPRDTVLDQHFAASVLVTVYLMVGCALAMLSIMGLWMAATRPLPTTLSLLAYACAAAMLLWWGWGAWLLHQHQRKRQASHRHAGGPALQPVATCPAPTTASARLPRQQRPVSLFGMHQ
ncbi:hypothetical protein [Comamonas jiangduensis]|uniref:hypothetical protein n=1 Tax=Comamonas jiangduensis TaxID=1194168 RepID=UPI0028A93B9D|nr:hypothetical protein [Comamonas jiangduensis]